MHNVFDVVDDPNLSSIQLTGKLGAEFTKNGAQCHPPSTEFVTECRCESSSSLEARGIITGFPYP